MSVMRGRARAAVAAAAAPQRQVLAPATRGAHPLATAASLSAAVAAGEAAEVRRLLLGDARTARWTTRLGNEVAGYRAAPQSAELPERLRGWEYYSARDGIAPDWVSHYRRPVGDTNIDGEQLLVSLGAAAAAAGTGYAALGVLRVSPEPIGSGGGRYVAYTLDTRGADEYTGVVEDTHAPAPRPPLAVLPRAASLVWAPHRPGCAPALYYTVPAANSTPGAEGDSAGADGSSHHLCGHVVMRHVLGRRDRALDEVVFTVPPPAGGGGGTGGVGPAAAFVDVVSSKDGALVCVVVNDRTTCAVYVLDYHHHHHSSSKCTPAVEGDAVDVAQLPTPPLPRPLLVVPPTADDAMAGDIDGATGTPPVPAGTQYSLEHHRPSGRLVAVTNDGGVGGADGHRVLLSATDPALLAAAIAYATGASATAGGGYPPLRLPWRELLPRRPGVVVTDVDVFDAGAVVYSRRLASVTSAAAPDPSLRAPAFGVEVLPLHSSGGSSVARPPAAVPLPLPAGVCAVWPRANADSSAGAVQMTLSFLTRPAVTVEYPLPQPAPPSSQQQQQQPAQPPAQPPRVLAAQGVGVAPGRPLFAASDYVSYVLHAPSWGDHVAAWVRQRTGEAASGGDGGVTLVPVTVVHRSGVGIDADEVQETAARICDDALRPRSQNADTEPPLQLLPDSPSRLLHALTQGLDDWRLELQPALASAAAALEGGDAACRYLPRRAGVPEGALSPSLPALAAARASWQRGLLRLAAARATLRGSAALPPDCHRGHTSAAPTRLDAPALSLLAAAGGGLRTYPPSWQWRHNNPALLRAYGAYGTPLSAELDPALLPLLSRGWVVAHAHVRGGGDGGERWYHAGRGRAKPNTLGDAAAACRLLVATGLTRAALLATATESAGGVVGGWLATARPGLAAAHVLRAPFVDVLGGMSDASHGLTRVEAAEWGAPAECADDAAAIAAYCPATAAAAAAAASGAAHPRYTDSPSLLVMAAAADARTPAAAAVQFVQHMRAAVGAPPAAAVDAQRATQRPHRGEPPSPLLLPLLLAHVAPHDAAGHGGPAAASLRAHYAGQEAAFLYRSLGLDLDAATSRLL